MGGGFVGGPGDMFGGQKSPLAFGIGFAQSRRQIANARLRMSTCKDPQKKKRKRARSVR